MAAFLAPDEGTCISGLRNHHDLRSAGREALASMNRSWCRRVVHFVVRDRSPTVEGPALCHDTIPSRCSHGRGHQHRPQRGCLLSLRAITRIRSIAEFHVKDIPALGAGSLRHGLDRMLIGNAREAIPIDLPVASGGAVGCQELRLGLGCGMPVNGVVLGVGQEARKH